MGFLAPSPSTPTIPPIPAPPPAAAPATAANPQAAASGASQRARAAAAAGGGFDSTVGAAGPQGLVAPNTGKTTLLGGAS